MKWIGCILISFILLACDKLPENSVIVDSFPFSEKLSGDTVNYFDSELGILDIKLAGKYWICSSHRTDYHFAIYSKDNFEKVAEICKNGRGPNEFLAPAYYSQYVIEEGDVKIWILERDKSEFMKINLDKSIREDSICVDQKYPVSKLVRNSFRDLFYCGDSLFIGTIDAQSCQHLLLDLGHPNVQTVEHALKFPKNFNPHNISQSISAKHPTKPLIASAFFNFPQIDFINSEGKIYKTVFYKEVIKPSQVTDSQSEECFFSDIYGDSDYVYLLLNRESLTETGLNPNESSVLVFNWNGEPVQEYKIPYASSICIDNVSHKLYALNPRKEYYNTTVYSLNNKR